MVKGKLLRNKRKRKTNYYPLEKKIKILSIEDLKTEDIRSKLNTGCLIVLKESGKAKQIIYDVSQNGKIISMASKENQDIALSTLMIGAINSLVSPKGYLIKTEKYIREGDYRYNKLNEKLQIVNQN